MVDQNFIQQSRLIKDINRILIEAHNCFILNNAINLLNDDNIDLYRSLQAKRCIGLLDIIRSTHEYKIDERLLRLQENVSKNYP